MTCTGRAGTWVIHYTFNGTPLTSSTYTGTEDDNPYFSNESGRAVLRSVCDGRNMEPPYFAGSFSTVSITSSVFTPDDIPEDKYDCVNSACIKSTVYNTPGIYDSLSTCETSCGSGCSGKCISNSEWAQIEGLASQIKSKECG